MFWNNKYPYTDFSQLNIDALARIVGKCDKSVKDLKSDMSTAKIDIVKINRDIDDINDRVDITENDISDIKDRINYYVTPEMFGAAGDGVTDDTEAIQAAIDTGIPVRFVSPSYVISETITISDNAFLYSMCRSSVSRKQTTDADTQYNIFSITAPAVIYGLVTIGNEYHHNTSGSTIDDGRTNIGIYNTENVIISDCVFEKIGSNGIYCSLSSNIEVIKSEFSKTTSQAGDAYAKAVAFIKCINTKVINCNIHDIDDGIGAAGTWNDDTIYINHIWSGNSFTNIGEHAIYGNMSYENITDNIIVNCGASAIKIRSIGSIIDNNVINSGADGIEISEPSRYNVVSNNNIYLHSLNHTGPNIGVGIPANNLKSVLQNYEGCSATDRMIGNKILNNIIRYSKDEYTANGTNIGIRLYGSSDYASSGDFAIQKTSILGNTILYAETGIAFLLNIQETEIQNNMLVGVSPAAEFSNVAYGHGITYVSGYQFNTRVFNNVIKNFYNGLDRRAGSGTSVYTYYRNNDILDNTNYGINFVAATLSSGMVVTENRFLRNGAGEYVIKNTAFYGNSMYDTTKKSDFLPVRESSAPTSGTWTRGDMVLNVSPSAGGNIGWVCVTGGTPGTWKTFGAISS